MSLRISIMFVVLFAGCVWMSGLATAQDTDFIGNSNLKDANAPKLVESTKGLEKTRLEKTWIFTGVQGGYLLSASDQSLVIIKNHGNPQAFGANTLTYRGETLFHWYYDLDDSVNELAFEKPFGSPPTRNIYIRNQGEIRWRLFDTATWGPNQGNLGGSSVARIKDFAKGLKLKKLEDASADTPKTGKGLDEKERTGGLVFVGRRPGAFGGYYLTDEGQSFVIITTGAEPPVFGANTMTYDGDLPLYWIFKLDGTPNRLAFKRYGDHTRDIRIEIDGWWYHFDDADWADNVGNLPQAWPASVTSSVRKK